MILGTPSESILKCCKSQYTFGRCPLWYISRKVGHSSVQITDRVYSHFFEDEFKNVPNVMEEFLTVKAN